MALKINSELETKDGGIVASGAVALYGLELPAVSFNAANLDLIFTMKIYRDQDAYETNKFPIKATKIRTRYTASVPRSSQSSLGFPEVNAVIISLLEESLDIVDEGLIEIIPEVSE